MNLLRAFFRLNIIMALPAGMQGVDPGGGAGLLQAFMNNANNYSQQMASYATTGNSVAVIAADVVDGVLQMNAGAGAGFTINLPTTAQILGALQASVPQDGSFTKIIRVVNNGSGQTGTLTAGDASTQIIGTATIGTNVCRDYALRVMASNINITNIGSLTL